MNECCSLPPSVLKANPAIQTFDQAFKRVRRRAPSRPVPVAARAPPASS